MTKSKGLDRLRASLCCPSKARALANPDSREKISRVAVKLFADHGIDGVSVRDIAKAADVNVALISYYFGGKDALYVKIIEDHTMTVRRLVTETNEKFKKLPASRENFAEQIRTVIAHCVDLHGADRDLMRLLQRERLNGLPFARNVVEKMLNEISGQTLELIETAKSKGVVRKDVNARVFMITISESIFGYFTMQDCVPKFLTGGFHLPDDRKEYIDFLVRLFTEGVYK